MKNLAQNDLKIWLPKTFLNTVKWYFILFINTAMS